MIPVFYSNRMTAEPQNMSPSASKPALVVESWKKFPIEIIEPTPVTSMQLERAHDPEYVRDILSLKRENGFRNTSASVAASLAYTSGAMLSAARRALITGGAAAAPCSGFHHAGYSQFETFGCFCTFNGLIVTAQALLDEGTEEGTGIDRRMTKVGILDFDMHFGNGTDDIIRTLKLEDRIKHFTAGLHYDHPTHADAFFRKMPEVLDWMSDCDVVLYQAGADPHVADPYGGWLTTEELSKRDLMVFEGLKARRRPVAWNLAGGYQTEPDGTIPKVLEIHDNTMRRCVEVHGT